jgi:hypothetical protein
MQDLRYFLRIDLKSLKFCLIHILVARRFFSQFIKGLLEDLKAIDHFFEAYGFI